MNIAEIIRQAADLIRDKEKWAQGKYAVNADDFDVNPRGDDAVGWCAMGALMKVSPPDDGHYGVAARECRETLDRDGLPRNLQAFNDTEPHHRVVALLDRTASRLATSQD